MLLTVDRDNRRYRTDGDDVLLPARDTARRNYLVAIARVRWEPLVARHGDDAVREVEAMTQAGRWETAAGRRVWRVGRA